MRRRASVYVVIALLLGEEVAHAQHAQRIRRRFEPTDLDLREAGTAEIDLQTGVIQGASSRRVIAPDIEAVVGLTSSAQLQIDTTMGFDDSHGSKFRFLENTWTSLKMGIFDQDDGKGTTWAGGIQAGPKLPTTAWSHALGAEAIAIVGRSGDRVHVFVQTGVLLDPYVNVPGARPIRPFALEGGIDLVLDLDDRDRWSWKTELGGARFFSLDTTEAHLTSGVGYQPAKWLELSLIGIAGLGPGDRYGVLFGASPHFDVL